MTGDILREKLHARTTTANAEMVFKTFKQAGLLDDLIFLKDGSSTSVFDIGGNLVLKLFDRRLRRNPRLYNRFVLDHYAMAIRDDGRHARLVIEVEPKLTDDGVLPIHQDVLRYKLWCDEKSDFWDIYPGPTESRTLIKNVMLDHRGVPYVIDEDAVKLSMDEAEYPSDEHGIRTADQYRRYRADSFDQLGRPDVISTDKWSQIKTICQEAEWPEDQKLLFNSRSDLKVLERFADPIQSLHNAPIMSPRR